MSGRDAQATAAALGRSGNPPRLALRAQDAAAALGVSDETFDRWIRPTLPVVRAGSVRLYPLAAIETWLAERASAPADDVGATGIGPPLRSAMADGRRARGPRGQRGASHDDDERA
ncbi:MAG: hypothetical protein QOH72_5516 [Solirubrobacteraceae bacterium]|nr:hypothetical protein [Solirubrobacteraceae bacterium]